MVNRGRTCPKVSGCPVAGQGANCLPLGSSGHLSIPGGKADLSDYLCCVHNVQLNFFQEVQVYKRLFVQGKNCATILDNCTAKLHQLHLFFLILPFLNKTLECTIQETELHHTML